MEIIRSRVKTTKWHLFFQYVSIALTMVSGILLVPLYLKFIPLELYGAWLATGNIMVWLTTIDPGLSTILQQRVGFVYGKKDFQAIGELITGGVFITVIIVFLIIAAGLLISDYFFLWLKLPTTTDLSILLKAFYLAVIGSSLVVFACSIIAINQGLQSSLGTGIIWVVVIAFKIVLTVILLYKGFGLIAVGISSLFMGIGLTLGNFGYLIWRVNSERIGLTLSLNKVPALFKLMSYTFLGRAASIFSGNMDLFFVSRYLGPESVVVLNLTRKVPVMSRRFIERPIVAFTPAISHLLGTGEIDKVRVILLRLLHILLWLLGLFVGGFIVLNDDFVRLWVGQKFFAGQTINLILCASFILAITVNGFGNLCFALGNIKGNSISGFIQAFLSIPLIIFGSKYLGLLGVVLAPVISMFAVQAWYLPLSFSRLLKFTWQDSKEIIHEILKVCIIILTATLFFANIYPNRIFHFIMLVIAFCLFYGFGLYLISAQLRVEIKGVLQKLRIFKLIHN